MLIKKENIYYKIDFYCTDLCFDDFSLYFRFWVCTVYRCCKIGTTTAVWPWKLQMHAFFQSLTTNKNYCQPSAAPQNLNPALNRKPYTWPLGRLSTVTDYFKIPTFFINELYIVINISCLSLLQFHKQPWSMFCKTSVFLLFSKLD